MQVLVRVIESLREKKGVNIQKAEPEQIDIKPIYANSEKKNENPIFTDVSAVKSDVPNVKVEEKSEDAFKTKEPEQIGYNFQVNEEESVIWKGKVFFKDYL